MNAPTTAAAQKRGARQLSPDARLLMATLRWRTRRLLRELPPRQALAARLLPVLLQASFSQRELRGEPPGVEGVNVQPSWAPLSRAFDLTPPLSRQGGRRLIQALLALPTPQGLVGYAVLSPNLGTAEARRVAERLAQVSTFYQHSNVNFLLSALPADALSNDADPLLQVMPFGALLAGWLPELTWHAGASQPLPSASVARLLAAARGPVARMALLMMAPGTSTPCLALREALRDGQSPRELADPEIFCAHWAARATPAGKALDTTYAIIRDLAAKPKPRPLAAPPPRDAQGPKVIAPEILLQAGHELAAAAVRAVRAVPRAQRAPFEALLRQEILSLDLPRLLLTPFGLAMKARHEGRGGRAGLQIRAEHGYECSLEAVPLALAATRAQSILRGQSLLAAANARPREASGVAAHPQWKIVADRMGHVATERSLLVAIESSETDGAPHDPLNRGQSRIYGFEGALALLERPGRRPTAFELNPQQTVTLLLREGARGTRIELRAADSRAHPAVARLQRLARFARTHTPGDALAVEAGGRVAQLDDHGVRWFELGRFALRPRRCRFDPEAPDLSAWAGEPARQRWAGQRSTISAQAVDLGNGRAGIFYLDAFGVWFREEVAVADLDDHLEGARLILREEPFPTLLAARLANELQEQLWKKRSEAPVASIELAIAGRLPFGLELVFGGERFGGGGELGWEAAAQAVLSSWPSGHRGRLSIRKVQVDVGDQPAHGIERLYARALVLRRMERMLRSMGVT